MSARGTKAPLPLPRRRWLAIFDRDATILSSREIAYACYQAAFDAVISEIYPRSRKLDERTYYREYNQLDRTGVYRKRYPRLSEEQLERAGEASWRFYLEHYNEQLFNRLIPGMDEFLRRFKQAGNLVVVLTASQVDGATIGRYAIPFDGFFSMARFRKERQAEISKREAIYFILRQFGKSPSETVTIGDNPRDHVEEILSVGTGFGLGSRAARAALKKSVRIYASRVRDLYRIFGISPPPAGKEKRR